MGDQLPPGRLLADEDIQSAIGDGQFYLEVYYERDHDTNLTSISTVMELNRAVALANSLRPPSHVWLMVPRFWSESIARPTAAADLARIQELFVPLIDKNAGGLDD